MQASVFKLNLKQNPFKCYSSIVLVFVLREQSVIRIKSGVPMYIGSLQQQPPLVEWQALTGSGSSITDKIQDQCSRDTLKNAEEVPMVAGGIERWSVFQTEVEEKGGRWAIHKSSSSSSSSPPPPAL